MAPGVGKLTYRNFFFFVKMRALFILQLLLLFTFNEKFGFCFPTGAGWSACYDLKPGFNPHGAGNTDESPYNVSLSDMTYDSNTTEITGMNDSCIL